MSDMVPEVLNAALDSLFTPKEPGELEYQGDDGLLYCRNCHIPKSEAKPGDLIFFQKTYNTSGASHVGIYVGNGMMIHCGNPISYASIETNYWRQHYYCMGRIR